MKIFVWSYQDMPGLDPSLVQHRLILKEGADALLYYNYIVIVIVKQKLRKMPPDIQQKVKEEVINITSRLHQNGG